MRDVDQSTSERRKRYRSPNRSYILPKDALEGERLDLQHHIFRYALRGEFAAPIEPDVSRILDVGSGTGIWGEEMALDFPGARIVNLDLETAERTVRFNQIANRAAARPPNWHFVQGNVLEGLPFPDNCFDFTHQRMLGVGIPAERWPSVLGELIRVTRSGGWIELLELGATYHNAGPVTAQLARWTAEIFARRGLNPKLMEELGTMAERAGLKAVQVSHLDLPLGAWDPYIGVLLEKDCLEVCEAIEPIICTALNISRTTYVDTLIAAAQEWKDNRVSCRFHLVQGQV